MSVSLPRILIVFVAAAVIGLALFVVSGTWDGPCSEVPAKADLYLTNWSLEDVFDADGKLVAPVVRVNCTCADSDSADQRHLSNPSAPDRWPELKQVHYSCFSQDVWLAPGRVGKDIVVVVNTSISGPGSRLTIIANGTAISAPLFVVEANPRA